MIQHFSLTLKHPKIQEFLMLKNMSDQIAQVVSSEHFEKVQRGIIPSMVINEKFNNTKFGFSQDQIKHHLNVITNNICKQSQTQTLYKLLTNHLDGKELIDYACFLHDKLSRFTNIYTDEIYDQTIEGLCRQSKLPIDDFKVYSQLYLRSMYRRNQEHQKLYYPDA